jgi:hypothetical protein
MKKSIKRLYGSVLFIGLLIAAFSVLSVPAKAIQVSSVSLNVVTKNVHSGGSISFSASDFSETIKDACGIRVASVPEKSLGVLKVGNELLDAGCLLEISELDNLVFCAGNESGVAAMFEVSAVANDGTERNVAVVVRVNSGPNYAPISQNLNLKTYKGVSVEGKFSALDPEGDIMSFEVVHSPKKGIVTVNGSSFVYTPAEGKQGRDVFTYYSMDSNGNVSDPATVHITISKQKTNVTYSDMKGNGAAYASVRLAEEGIFVGEKLASSYFFAPYSTVSRGEFLALCMKACGVETIKDLGQTGFADDSFIETWLKPYVSAAVLSDIIGGYKTDEGAIVFSADRPVTYAEAAVILNKILKFSDVTEAVSANKHSVPAWAYQASSNLSYSGIMPLNPELMAGGTLTRADVAVMLCSAMDLVDKRGGDSLLNWASR